MTKGLVECNVEVQVEKSFVEEEGQKTLKNAKLQYFEVVNILKVTDLQSYVEQTERVGSGSQWDLSGPKRATKSFLMYPKDMKVFLKLSNLIISDKRSLMRINFDLDDYGEAIHVALNLKEFNTYLIFFQLLIQLVRDINDIIAEANPQAKRKLNEADNIVDALQLENAKQKPVLNLSLEDILKNENLDQQQPASNSRARALWKKAISRVVDRSGRQDVVLIQAKIGIQEFKFTLRDNTAQAEAGGQIVLPMISFIMSDFSLKLDTLWFKRKDPYQMDRLFVDEMIQQPYMNLVMQQAMECLYYNQRNCHEEYLMEPFPMYVLMYQERPLTEAQQLIKIDKIINVNLTYGFLASLYKSFQSLLKYDQHQIELDKQRLKAEQNKHQPRPVGNIANSSPYDSIAKQSYEFSQMSQMPGHYGDVGGFLEDDEGIRYEEDCINADATNFVFENELGTEIMFSIYELRHCLTMDSQYAPVPNNNILLGVNQKMLIPIRDFDHAMNLLGTGSAYQQNLFSNSMKISFVMRGYKRIEKVLLHKNGIFGYFLYNERDSKEYPEKSDVSCVIQVRREHSTIYCTFKSSLVLLNSTDSPLHIISKRHEQHDNHARNVVMEYLLPINQTFPCPIEWFKSEDNYSLFLKDENPNQPQHLLQHLLIKSVREVFDPRITDPHHDRSLVVKSGSQYVALNIYYLKTDTSVGQFLVLFQPIVKLVNLLFTEIALLDLQQINLPYIHLYSGESKPLYTINPYLEQDEQFMLSFRAEEQEYYERVAWFKMSKLTRNKTLGFTKGFKINLKKANRKDHNHQQMPFQADQEKNTYIQIVFEQYSGEIMLKDIENEEFVGRSAIYSKTKSLYFVIYTPYIAVNSTNHTMILNSPKVPTTLDSYKSTYFGPKTDKMKILINGYEPSQPFNIRTGSSNGSIKLAHELKIDNHYAKQKEIATMKKHPHLHKIVTTIAQVPYRYLELGISVQNAPHPYQRTKIVKFLPRFYIINQLNVPVVLKEKKSTHQMVIVPNEGQVYSFFSGTSKIMLRLLDIDTESKDIDQEHEEDQYRQVKNLQHSLSNKNAGGPGEKGMTQEMYFRLKGGDSEKYSKNTDKKDFMGEKRVITINEEIGNNNELRIWSYPFSAETVNDFQVRLPNPNPRHFGTNSWSQNMEFVYARVNVNEQKSSEGTLFMTISQPVYPDIVFFNNTEQHVIVSHKSQSKDKENEELLLDPKEKKPFVLNPNDLMYDRLQIKFFQTEINYVKGFSYRISNLKKTIKNYYYIQTTVTGNMKYVELMHFMDRPKGPSQEQHKDSQMSEAELARQNLHANQKDDEKQSAALMNAKLELKGFGLSIVNMRPREICYISMFNIEMKLLMKAQVVGRITKNRFQFGMRLMNFQIDNMASKSFPVVLYPQDPFRYEEEIYNVKSSGQHVKVLDNQQPNIYTNPAQFQPFLLFDLDLSTLMENDVSNIRIRRLAVDMKEIVLKIHGDFINAMLKFVENIVDLYSDKTITPFFESRVYMNYKKMIEIVNLKRQGAVKQDGYGALLPYQTETYQRSDRKRDLAKLDKLSKLVSKQFRRVRKPNAGQTFVKKEDVCPLLKSSPTDASGHHNANSTVAAGKIFVQTLLIKDICVHFTFRMKPLEQLIRPQSLLYPFVESLSHFLNVSDAQLKFDGFITHNLYDTAMNLAIKLILYYVKKGAVQFYSVIGATDILGNPANLVINLGRGAKSLYRKAIDGNNPNIRDKQTVAIDIREGVKNFLAQSTYGISNSVQKFTGTLYLGLRSFAGKHESLTDLENPHSLMEGLEAGALDMAGQVRDGLDGLSQIPQKRLIERGYSRSQLVRGKAQGVFALVTSPLTGALIFAYDVSTGIKNYLKGKEIVPTRLRFPRYIDENGIMRVYHHELSQAFTVLEYNQVITNGLDVLICGFPVAYVTDTNPPCLKEGVFILTDERVMYVKELVEVAMMIPVKYISSIDISQEDPTVLLFVLKDGITRRLKTGNADNNIRFLEIVQQAHLMMGGRQNDQAIGTTTTVETRTVQQVLPY